jgi:Arc/MetJ-type ribon-helix-helix transcriptional regulator
MNQLREVSLALPEQVVDELDARVAQGEFRSLAEAVETALRYYFERHGEEAWALYLEQELRAGLGEHG